VQERLNAALPPGVRVLEVCRLAGVAASLSATLDLAEYRAWINAARQVFAPEEFAGLETDAFHSPVFQAERIAALCRRDRIEVERVRKGTAKVVDIRPFVAAISYLESARELQLVLRLGPNGHARPQEVLQALYGVPGTCFRLRRQALGVETRLAAPDPVLLA
jgi:hypothetical protein